MLSYLPAQGHLCTLGTEYVVSLTQSHALRVGELRFTTNRLDTGGCVLLSEEVGDACWVGWALGLLFGDFKMHI